MIYICCSDHYFNMKDEGVYLMADGDASYEKNFSEWLAKQVSPAQLSAIYLAITDINEFCLSRNILKEPLFEIDDLTILSSVWKIIENDKNFSAVYKRQKNTMVMAIKYYYQFIQETKTNDGSIESRPKYTLNGKAKDLRQKSFIKTVPAEKNSLANSSNPQNRLNFIDWLHERGVATGEIFAVLSSLKQCSYQMRKEKLIDDAIYYIMPPKMIAAIHSFLNMPHLDTRYRKALNLYLDFLNEHLTQPVPEIIANEEEKTPISANINTLEISEIDRLLCDDVFEPLKLALRKENVSTIEELKSLKLWAFMNQNNLYFISMRQTVFDKVQHLLDPETAENPELLYELHCGTSIYTGSTPAKAFLHFCEDVAKKHPLIFRSMLDKPIGGIPDVKIYRTPENNTFIRMENPTCYIEADLAKDSIIPTVKWIMMRCEGKIPLVSIKDPKTSLVDSTQTNTSTEICTIPTCSAHSTFEQNIESVAPSLHMQKSADVDAELIEKASEIVLKADMNGITYDCLSQTLHLTMAATQALVRQCKHIVEIKGKLYHENAFVDWDDGANQMCLIIEKLMRKNNGYVSAAQLYAYARTEMNMFLNDNDVNDERCVYEIAQHLFEKNSFGNNHYSFTGKTHISKPEKAIDNNFDIICRFAEEQGGVFREEDLSEYLTSVGIKTGNLRAQMRLNKTPDFFFYEPGTIIAAKSMGIDNLWKESVGRALLNLLNDADGHIILRQIQPIWYESLPSLPEHRQWTPLLLQYILRFFGKELNARTIAAMKSQSMDTLHAMLVKYDSPIQNFGDAVISYLIDSETDQRSFEAEELRQFLVKTGMIQGNELIWNMPKALAKDERFAWDAKGENVTIRV